MIIYFLYYICFFTKHIFHHQSNFGSNSNQVLVHLLIIFYTGTTEKETTLRATFTFFELAEILLLWLLSTGPAPKFLQDLQRRFSSWYKRIVEEPSRFEKFLYWLFWKKKLILFSLFLFGITSWELLSHS